MKKLITFLLSAFVAIALVSFSPVLEVPADLATVLVASDLSKDNVEVSLFCYDFENSESLNVLYEINDYSTVYNVPVVGVLKVGIGERAPPVPTLILPVGKYSKSIATKVFINRTDSVHRLSKSLTNAYFV